MISSIAIGTISFMIIPVLKIGIPIIAVCVVLGFVYARRHHTWSSICRDLLTLEKLITDVINSNPENGSAERDAQESLAKTKTLIQERAPKYRIRSMLDQGLEQAARTLFVRHEDSKVLEAVGRRAWVNEHYWGYTPYHCWGLKGLQARNRFVRTVSHKLGML